MSAELKVKRLDYWKTQSGVICVRIGAKWYYAGVGPNALFALMEGTGRSEVATFQVVAMPLALQKIVRAGGGKVSALTGLPKLHERYTTYRFPDAKVKP